MKKYSIFMAAAALAFAACNKAEIEVPSQDVNSNVETELITVDLNPMTKTSLSGTETLWSDGDAVSVTVGGKNLGSLTWKEGTTFSGEIEAGYDGKSSAILNYPAGETAVPTEQDAVAGSFANGAALLEGTTTVDALRAGEGTTLQNKTALLKFKSARNGNVVFTVGEATYTVKGCEVNKEYYACIAPAAEALLSYTLGENEGAKSKTATFEAGKIYPLGTLTEEFVPQPGYTYLQVTEEWKTDNPRFAAYFYMIGTDNASIWKNLSLIEGQVDIYGYKVPGAFNGVIFCRMDPNKTENKWDNKWNQTVDLDLSTNSMFTITNSWDEKAEGKATGDWSGESAVDNNLYLQPNANWKKDNARFAAYFFGNGETWVSMTDQDKDGIYEVKKPSDKNYPSVIFCRMNPSATANNWNNKWNQTGDLTIPTDGKNLFAVPNGAWDGSTSTWSVKE